MKNTHIIIVSLLLISLSSQAQTVVDIGTQGISYEFTSSGDFNYTMEIDICQGTYNGPNGDYGVSLVDENTNEVLVDEYFEFYDGHYFPSSKIIVQGSENIGTNPRDVYLIIWHLGLPAPNCYQQLKGEDSFIGEIYN